MRRLSLGLGWFLLVLVRPPLGADSLWLTDGSRVEGDVMELGGNSVSVALPGRQRTIPKRAIKKVTFSYHESDDSPRDRDLVLCRNGRKLVGDVTVSEDGRTVEVRFDDGNRVALPRGLVQRIVRRTDNAVDLESSVYYTRETEQSIKKALADLQSPDRSVRERAEGQLKDHGIFASPHVEAAREGPVVPDTPAREALERIHHYFELQKLVSRNLEQMEPRIYRILGGNDVNEKEQLLQEMFSRFPDDSAQVGRHLLTNPTEDWRVRAFVVGALGGLQKNRELLDIYQQTGGQVQLAAAIALGRNRILVGIPTLIEALELENRAIRKLAAESLLEFTGEDFEYHADDTPLSRRRSIDLWKAWWRKNEQGYLLQSRAALAGKSVDTPQRQRALELWGQAGEATDAEEYEQAEFLLRRAVKVDPTFMNAHVHLAVHLYTRAGKLEEARRVLEDLLNRRIPGTTRADIRWVHYHLGRVHQLEGDLELAYSQFKFCVEADPDFSRAHLAMGDVSYQRATRGEGLQPAERKKLIALAVEHYQAAVRLIEDEQKSMVVILRKDLPIEEVPTFDMKEHNRTVLEVRGRLRLARCRTLQSLARAESLLGSRDVAIGHLLDAVTELRDETDPEARALQVEIRNYLGVLYEELGEFAAAYREYRVILRQLDRQNSAALEGLKRLEGRLSSTAGRRPRPPR